MPASTADPLEQVAPLVGTELRDGWARFTAEAGGSWQAVVGRMDTLVKQYAEILREDPTNTEAAFNYEYIVRLRQVITRANNRTLRLTATDWVKNGDRWTVLKVTRSGGLTVRHHRNGRTGRAGLTMHARPRPREARYASRRPIVACSSGDHAGDRRDRGRAAGAPAGPALELNTTDASKCFEPVGPPSGGEGNNTAHVRLVQAAAGLRVESSWPV